MGIIIRQSLKGTIVNYVGAFIGFVTTMFVSTKFLTPEELGLTRVMIEAAAILGGLMALGIGSSGLRFFPFFKTDKNSQQRVSILFTAVSNDRCCDFRISLCMFENRNHTIL